jgi:hypothetical protein
VSESGQALAERFATSNQQLVELVERLTPKQWSTSCKDEGWPAGVTAHHVAEDHLAIAGFVQALVAGQALPNVTIVMLDQANARHAETNAACTKDETIALLRRNGDAVVTLLGNLREEQLERTGAIPFFGGQTMSARGFIEQILIGHIYMHLPNIQAVAAPDQ